MSIANLLSSESFAEGAHSSAAPLVTIGTSDRPVHLIEYVDFECGFCRLMWEPIKRIVANHTNQIYLEVRQFPLNPVCNRKVKHQRHPFACELAKAAYCAATIGKADEFADWAFALQGRVGMGKIVSKLNGLGLADAGQCIQSEAASLSIKADIEAAIASEVKGTPHILINGRRYSGDLNISGIMRAIELVSAD
jgi:protein-disulfide isomerase